jgi:hypothetical protein
MAAPAAAAAAVGGNFLMNLLSDIMSPTVWQDRRLRPLAPSQYGVAESSVSKPYFQGAAPELAYTQYYANEAFKRNLLIVD